MRLATILYEFKNIDRGGQKNYYFQLLKNRKLTDIYHSHDFYEIILFLEGNAKQLVNEQEYYCKKNTLLLLRPGDRHCFISQSNDTETLSLSARKEEFESFLNLYDPRALHIINNSSSPIWLDFSLPSILSFNLNATSNWSEYDCKLILSYFIYRYINNIDELENPFNCPQMLTYAIGEMKKEENLKAGITAFSKLSGYSHSHLARLIKLHFGMSLKQYINELRLQSAYNDIVLTNRNIEDISEGLGFSSFSHFNKIFKERFSITPARLRKSDGIWTA